MERSAPAHTPADEAPARAGPVATRPDLTVVMPIFNEAANVDELVARLTKTLDEMGLAWQLLFVDDGSADDTVARLAAHRERDPRVTYIEFSRNFGHHCAMTAGIDHARGEVVALMDSDLQDQPEELPKLWAKLHEGYDVVFARLDARRESWLKALLSRAFWWVFGVFTGIKLQNPGVFRVMRRKVVLALRQLPERSRFLVGLIAWVGFRQTQVTVERAPRSRGRTNYNLAKMLALSIHAITGFSRGPLRVATYLAGIFALFALSFGGWTIYKKLVYGTSMEGWASLMTVISFGFASILMMLGIIGEYLANVLSEVQARPLYVVRERVGVGEDLPRDEAPATLH